MTIRQKVSPAGPLKQQRSVALVSDAVGWLRV
jgi:hypothetical protein